MDLDKKFTYNCSCGEKLKRKNMKETIHNNILYLYCPKCNFVLETQTKNDQGIITVLNVSDRKIHIKKWMG